MSGYAPNPDSCENAAAPLTSSLLARKGQATPAVDAVAHEGVDIDMNSMRAPPRRKAVSEEAIETLYAENPQQEDERPRRAHGRGVNGADRSPQRPERAPITIDSPPQNWTVSSPPPSRPRLLPAQDSGELPAPSAGASARPSSGALRAIVTFRMPATDFVRLRRASREMRESCQTIILDALGAYLDANEVEIVDEATAIEEATRLARRGGRKR
jgi:hypothetical protein